MENKETIIYIKQIIPVKSKAGRDYWNVVGNNEEKYSCFEKKIIDELIKKVGQSISVEIAENEKGFKNIRKIMEVKSEKIASLEPKPSQTSSQSEEDIKEARKAKDVSIYTSYAKDIFIELFKAEMEIEKIEAIGRESTEAIMERAITIVKQARDSFRES